MRQHPTHLRNCPVGYAEALFTLLGLFGIFNAFITYLYALNDLFPRVVP